MYDSGAETVSPRINGVHARHAREYRGSARLVAGCRQAGSRRLRWRPSHLRRRCPAAGGDRPAAWVLRASGALHRGSPRSRAHPAHAVGDDPLPRPADRRRLSGRQRLRHPAQRSRLQDGGRPAAGERRRPVLATDHRRLENLLGPLALKRMMAAMVELFCDSFATVLRHIVLDIDDTEDRVHGAQQLSLFQTHYDGRCFLPMHIYEATTDKPVAVILQPGKTPDGAEVAFVLRHVVRAIHAHWPRVDILVRGDSHYGRHEAMS
ncbi:transposase (plasmid) [Azospirillum sp. B510]|nr:transposase [Azospirillum sp. B510]